MKFNKIKTPIFIALIVIAVGAFLYSLQNVNPVTKLQREDVAKDLKRFTPSESIDISQAMKLVTFDPPQMLNPPHQSPPLLLYPPTADELARLSGE